MRGDVYNSPALPPIVQHTINGMKVCASRSENLSFATAQRPQVVSYQTSDTESYVEYVCPAGFKACNEELLSTKATAEKAICIDESLDAALHCPITKVEFSIDSYSAQDQLKFEIATTKDGTGDKHIYFSKLTADLPVYEMRVGAAAPCLIKNSRTDDLTVFFAELRAFQPQCEIDDEHCELVELPAGQTLTEYSF